MPEPTPNQTQHEIEAVLRMYEPEQIPPVDLESTVHYWLDRAMDAEQCVALMKQDVDHAEAKAIEHGLEKDSAQEQLAIALRRYDSVCFALIVASIALVTSLAVNAWTAVIWLVR